MRANLTAALHWPDERVPRITLTNTGPATARAIEYAVEALADQAPVQFKAGPWPVDRLKRGESDEREVWGLYGSAVMVTATWTDDDGAQELSWTVDFPDKPRSTPASRHLRR